MTQKLRIFYKSDHGALDGMTYFCSGKIAISTDIPGYLRVELTDGTLLFIELASIQAFSISNVKEPE